MAAKPNLPVAVAYQRGFDIERLGNSVGSGDDRRLGAGNVGPGERALGADDDLLDLIVEASLGAGNHGEGAELGLDA